MGISETVKGLLNLGSNLVVKSVTGEWKVLFGSYVQDH